MTRKLSNDGRLIDLSDRMDALKRLFARDSDIIAVYVYGSYGTADQTPLSDVDLAVLFRPDCLPDIDRQLRLIDKITECARNEDVSITILNDLPTVSQFSIISTGRLMYVSDHATHADFLERVFKMYGDYEPLYRRFITEYDEALVEAYSNGR